MIKIKLALIIIILMFSFEVNADCFFNGTSYPEGAVVNGKTCVNGEWR